MLFSLCSKIQASVTCWIRRTLKRPCRLVLEPRPTGVGLGLFLRAGGQRDKNKSLNLKGARHQNTKRLNTKEFHGKTFIELTILYVCVGGNMAGRLVLATLLLLLVSTGHPRTCSTHGRRRSPALELALPASGCGPSSKTVSASCTRRVFMRGWMRVFSRAGRCRRSCSDGYAGLWLVFGRERSRDSCGRLWAGGSNLDASQEVISSARRRRGRRLDPQRTEWLGDAEATSSVGTARRCST